MDIRLDHLNVSHKHFCLGRRNDIEREGDYPWWMTAPFHDWYLKEWLATLRKKQADIARDLDWNKARVSLMIRGEQQYNRDAINELAAYLNIRPHELLMHPDDAMALRRLREDAIKIAAEAARDDSPDAVAPERKRA